MAQSPSDCCWLQTPAPRPRRAQVSALEGIIEDVFQVMVTNLHALDLGRLSLCSKGLLDSCEACAASLCRHAEGQVVTTPKDRSWRYCYLMIVETAAVGNDKLRCILQALYAADPKANKLNLYGLDIGDNGVEHLALALRAVDHVKLESINLGGNNISDAGMRNLVRGVERHLEVDSISLNNNCIGRAGARALAMLMARCTHLRTLSLSQNPITDEGAEALGTAVLKSSLTTLCLRSMEISAKAREGIRSSWTSRGSSLLHLYL